MIFPLLLALAFAPDTTIRVEVHITTGRDTVTLTRRDTVTVVRRDTVTIGSSGRDTVFFTPQTNARRDSVLWAGPFPWPSGCVVGCRPANFALPLAPAIVRVDTVRIVDTVRVTPPVVSPPTTTPNKPIPPELPRGTVDTTMPIVTGDTIRVPRR